MAGLQEQALWDAEIYQIEQTDPVVGGPPNLVQGQGITNVPHQALANRTVWLKAEMEVLLQALGGDLNFATTIASALGGKLNTTDFTQSLTSGGYQVFPSGLIVQWTTKLSQAGGSQFAAFPIAFPNGELRTMLTPWVSATNNHASAVINSVGASGVNWSGFSGAAGQPAVKATQSSVRVSIIAVGY